MKLPAALLLAAVATGCGRSPALNVLVVTLDTTRADHLHCYGHQGIETPSIDSVAAEGTLYERAETPVPITLPSHTSIFTGTFPVFHGVRENGGFYVPERLETMAELLTAAGYDTAAFVGAFPLDSQTGMDQGFAVYDDNYPTQDTRHPLLRSFFDERPAAEVAGAALAWLEEHGDRPFFLWTHFFDPHQPQMPPAPYRERYASSLYDGEIASVDEAIGRILQALRERGLYDHTMVVVVGDHGESLGEHGEQTHAILLYQATMRVPLIVRLPGWPAPRRVRSLVSTVDILPTVLGALGLPVPSACQGRPLPAEDAQAKAARELYGESLYGRLLYGWSALETLTDGRYSLIRGPRSEQLYDLESDPNEVKDLAAGRPDIVAGMAARCRSVRAELAAGGSELSQGPVSAENLARLEALGYVGGGGKVDGDAGIPDPERRDPHRMMELLGAVMESRSLADEGSYELAIPILERAQTEDPANPWVVRELALAFLARGEIDRARVAVERLTALNADHIGTRLVLAEYEIALGNLGAALEHTERAVELDPGNLATRLSEASLLEDLGRLPEAEAVYREILAKRPNETVALNRLATIALREQRVEEGVELLERLRKLQPYFPPVYVNLAVVAHDQGNPEEALRLVERSLKLRPDQAKALELRGMCLEELGRVPEALAAWRQVQALAEDDETAQRAKAALEHLSAPAQ